MQLQQSAPKHPLLFEVLLPLIDVPTKFNRQSRRIIRSDDFVLKSDVRIQNTKLYLSMYFAWTTGSQLALGGLSITVSKSNNSNISSIDVANPSQSTASSGLSILSESPTGILWYIPKEESQLLNRREELDHNAVCIGFHLSYVDLQWVASIIIYFVRVACIIIRTDPTRYITTGISPKTSITIRSIASFNRIADSIEWTFETHN